MVPPIDHDQARKQMCCCCGGLAGPTKVGSAISAKIQRWAQPEWSPSVLSHPTGICEKCRRLLGYCERYQSTDIPGRPSATDSWKTFELKNINVPRGQPTGHCACPICEARKGNPIGKKGFKKKGKQIIGVEDKKNKENKNGNQLKKVCVKCFLSIGRGIPHKCVHYRE